MFNLLKKDKEILNEFKIDLGIDSNGNDYELIKFLSSEKWDLEKTLKKYENYLEWRNSGNTHKEIIARVIPDVKHLIPSGTHKTDKEGRSVFIERLGQLNFNDIEKNISVDEWASMHIFSIEKLLEINHQAIYILDLKGISFSTRKIFPYSRKVGKIDDKYYPNVFYRIFIINVSTPFAKFLSIFEKFFGKDIKERIKIYNHNFQNDLLELISHDSLPTEYGGSCDCSKCLAQNFNDF